MDATSLAVAGILATVIVALATLVVAFQTKRLARATADLGTQAERQVGEMEASRKLEWAPYLTFQPTDGGDVLVGDLAPKYTAFVTNIGRGPAINCILVRYFAKSWRLSSMFDLGHGDKDKFIAYDQQAPMPSFLGADPGIGTALFCQDQFGACHMFSPPRPVAISTSADASPNWAAWYRQQIAPK